MDADCPLSGQVLTVRGSTVMVNHNWSLGDHVSKDNAGWTVAELARALEKLPIEDHFDKLAYVRRAYNITSREQLQQLLNAIFDTDERPEPARTSYGTTTPAGWAQSRQCRGQRHRPAHPTPADQQPFLVL